MCLGRRRRGGGRRKGERKTRLGEQRRENSAVGLSSIRSGLWSLSLGCQVVITSPVAKEISDDTVLTELLDEGWYILLEERFYKRNKLVLALIYGLLGLAKQGPTLSELGQILVNVRCHTFGIRSRREGLKRGGAIVDIYAVLLHALSGLKALALLAGDNTIAKLQHILEPKAVFPAPPYVVPPNRDSCLGRDGVSVNGTYTQTKTM